MPRRSGLGLYSTLGSAEVPAVQRRFWFEDGSVRHSLEGRPKVPCVDSCKEDSSASHGDHIICLLHASGVLFWM